MDQSSELTRLVSQMQPRQNPGSYAFCQIPEDQRSTDPRIIASFREAEGTTAIVELSLAQERDWSAVFVAAWITLDVHSELESVGLTAAVAAELARGGISCNVVAAIYHDHLFIPWEHAERAISLLKAMSDRCRQQHE